MSASDRPTREQIDAALARADYAVSIVTSETGGGGSIAVLAAEVRALRAELAAVFALHEPWEHHRPKGKSFTVCAHCTSGGDPYTAVSTDWPCPTVKAIGGGS